MNKIELIRKYYNNLLIGYFGIKNKTKFVKKYYEKSLHINIKIYIRGYNIYLVPKPFIYTLYKDL